MKKLIKKGLAVLLSMCMTLTLMPATMAKADDKHEHPICGGYVVDILVTTLTLKV